MDEIRMGLLEPDDPEFNVTETGEHEESGHERRTIVVVVFAPKEPEPRRFRFALKERVGDAARIAAQAFGYEVGTPSFQRKDGIVIEPGPHSRGSQGAQWRAPRARRRRRGRVSALPPAMARASVEDELDAARAWAARHGWILRWRSEDLSLRAATYHEAAGRLVEVVGVLDGYRALPPAWRFVQPGTGVADPASFPAPGQGSIPGSIFHSNAVICAPWNRLAYAEHGGPHGDWSGPAAWLQASGMTVAHTLADMLSALDVHLRQSAGMMA